MPIIEINREHSGCRLKMIECPCGEDLENSQASSHIANHHNPQDFGLSPIDGEA